MSKSDKASCLILNETRLRGGTRGMVSFTKYIHNDSDKKCLYIITLLVYLKQ